MDGPGAPALGAAVRPTLPRECRLIPPPFFLFFPQAVRVATQEVGQAGGPVALALGAAVPPAAPPPLLFSLCTPSRVQPRPAMRHAGRTQGGGGRLADWWPRPWALRSCLPSPVPPPLCTQHPFIAAHAPLFGTRPPARSVTKVALLVPFANRFPCSTGRPGPVACILDGARIHLDSQFP